MGCFIQSRWYEYYPSKKWAVAHYGVAHYAPSHHAIIRSDIKYFTPPYLRRYDAEWLTDESSAALLSVARPVRS